MRVLRYEDGQDKTFLQQRYDGAGDWFDGLDGQAPILYRLDDLATADPWQPVFQALGAMDDALLVQLLAVCIHDHHSMVLVSPVNADLPPRPVLLGGLRSPRDVVAFYGGTRSAAFSARFTLRALMRTANLSQTVEPVEGDRLSASAS